MSNLGTIAVGIKAPIIKHGDNLEKIVVNSFKAAVEEIGIQPSDGDVLGITESVIARSQGNYASVEEIAMETERLFGEDAVITVVNPIYSRNRFAICLRGIARAAKKVILVMPHFDEVGNPGWSEHPFTKCVYSSYYKGICEAENAEVEFVSDVEQFSNQILIASIHDRNMLKQHIAGFNHEFNVHTLCDYFPDKCEYGLLGSNKASEELVKLFPNVRKARQFVYRVQEMLDREFPNVKMEILIYGDGCFKNSFTKGVSIWELADPVVCPAYTAGIEGTPNEVKIKYLADNEFSMLRGEELEDSIKSAIKERISKDVIGGMDNQGCTPRSFTDIYGSTMDLVSGSGSKGTPFVWLHHPRKNYAQD